MEKLKTKCWEYKIKLSKNSSDVLYTTLPRHSYGCNLISCLSCGEVYAYDVMSPFYIRPLESVLEETNCISCSKKLSETSKPFPDSYLSQDGEIKKSDDADILISSGSDENSIIHEFWDLYSDEVNTSTFSSSAPTLSSKSSYRGLGGGSLVEQMGKKDE